MRKWITLAWHFLYLGVNGIVLGVAQGLTFAIAAMPAVSVIVIVEQMFQYVKAIIIISTFKDMDLDVKIGAFRHARNNKLETFTIWLAQAVAAIGFCIVNYFMASIVITVGILFQIGAYLKIVLDSEMQEIKDVDDKDLDTMVKSVGSDLGDLNNKYKDIL